MVSTRDKRFGARLLRVHQWAFYEDSGVVDPDFDADDGSIAALVRLVATTGAIALHPDGDRRSGRDDPVPLCSHIPDGTSAAEFPNYDAMKRSMAKRALEEEQRMKADANTAEARRRAREELDWENELLRNLRLNEPIAARCGRVFREFVMINECDEGTANPEPQNVRWSEILRCRGFIIYKRIVIGDVYIGDSM